MNQRGDYIHNAEWIMNYREMDAYMTHAYVNLRKKQKHKEYIKHKTHNNHKTILKHIKHIYNI